MEFSKEIKNGILILHLSGDMIGEANGMQLVTAANEAIEKTTNRCIIDIQGLRYINSSGIGVLITILTKFRNRGGEVYLMKPSDHIKKLLNVTKLNAIFQIIQSEDEIPI